MSDKPLDLERLKNMIDALTIQTELLPDGAIAKVFISVDMVRMMPDVLELAKAFQLRREFELDEGRLLREQLLNERRSKD